MPRLLHFPQFKQLNFLNRSYGLSNYGKHWGYSLFFIPTPLPSGQARPEQAQSCELRWVKTNPSFAPSEQKWPNAIDMMNLYLYNKQIFFHLFLNKVSSLYWLFSSVRLSNPDRTMKIMKKEKTMLGKPILARISKPSSKPCEFFLSCLFIRLDENFCPWHLFHAVCLLL